MRFSTITALCAAPLALAGSLESDMSSRGLVEREEGVSVQVSQGEAGVAAAAAQGITVPSGSATEIIVIWINNGGAAPTQTVNAMSTVAGVNAAVATHNVTVGGSAGGLTYQPSSVFANVGDMVVFNFLSQNHSVTQSAFAEPCVKLPNGMDSGFMPNPNNTVSPAPAMAMQVTVATPLWFYCRQAGHCGKGMTFSINPQNATTGGNKTQAAFQALAVAQNGTGTTPAIAGGAGAAPAASAAPPPPPPAAASAAPPAAVAPPSVAATMAAGTGAMNNGACACSCLCGQAAFPNAAVQGVGAFGGMPGAMPMAALEAI